MMLTLDREKKIPSLNPVTRETLELFIQRLIEHEGENLKKVVLFGSVARKESDKDSDIDVLVILKKMTQHDYRLVSDIGADVKWDMDYDENAYLQPMTVSEEETGGLAYWELMQNIGRDGVTLYDAG
jgi:predicted nucleotidyltransferase